MGRLGPNRTEVDQIGPNNTKVDRIEKIGPKWTKYN